MYQSSVHHFCKPSFPIQARLAVLQYGHSGGINLCDMYFNNVHSTVEISQGGPTTFDLKRQLRVSGSNIYFFEYNLREPSLPQAYIVVTLRAIVLQK
jgi:hypothetical protein